ncbi:MAG: dTMP kinase [Chloroflexota bacterium]
MDHLRAKLIAIEGIDQAGKQTVCERLAAALRAAGLDVELTGFPDYSTPLGAEITAFLRGQREYPAQARQLLYAANRWERADDIRAALERGATVIVDRYIASGMAYGAAQGLDAAWMREVERGLPTADVTILLDITPAESLARKPGQRDSYEARSDLLERARDVYLALAKEGGWLVIDARGDRDSVWALARTALGL